MVTDTALRHAAAQAQDVLLTTLAAEQANLHKFSAAFEKKLQKLVRRARHPMLHRTLRYAAVIVLTLATLFGSVMALSPEARAQVAGWFGSVFGSYTHYDNVDATQIPDAAAEMELDYYLPAIVQGYAPLQETETPGGKTYMYVHESTGNILFFSYAYAQGSGSSFWGVEGYTEQRVQIGQLEGDLYTTQEEGKSNVIVWTSRHGGILFELSGDLEGQELIRLAESVRHQVRTPVSS